MPVNVFISHAREDSAHLHALERHLTLMQRQGVLSAWHAELVVPGQDWGAEVAQRLLAAQVIILLVSSGYFSSDVAYKQMEFAVQRWREGKAIVLPVHVRPCVLQGSRLNGLAKLPDNGEPVTSWPDQDAAWTNVASGIRQALVNLNGGKTISPVTASQPVKQLPVAGAYGPVSSHSPSSGGYVPVSSVRAPMSSNPSSWAGQGRPPPSSATGYAAYGAAPPPYSKARVPRSPASPGFFSWVWRGFALTIVAAIFYVGWAVLRVFSSGSGESAVIPDPQGSVVEQAAFVPLDWGPGSSACRKAEPQIILGNCQQFRSLEWLRSELSKLQTKGVGCLPDLPTTFTLQSGDDAAKGIKNYYLFIVDASGTQRIGNVWIQGGKLKITNLATGKKFWLAYDDSGAWSAGTDPDRVKLVP